MKQIPTTMEFKKITGKVYDPELFKSLGLTPCCVTGSFCQEHRDQLLEFCKKNPEFHIISYVSNGYFNKYLSYSDDIFLGEGNPDPDLVHLFSIEHQQFMAEITDFSKRRTSRSR